MVTFANPLGLISLISLLILLAFYLYFKRPEKKIFPSIMFFIKSGETKKQSFMFKRFMSNFLLLLQLLLLALLCFAIASPILNSTQEASQEHIVLVIDGSASMNAKYQSGTRFSNAIADAKSTAQGKGKVSIILAENLPLILLEEGSSEQAVDVLNTLKASDTTGTIGDAMLQAMQVVDGGTVYVFSDFSTIGTTDPILAKRQLNSRGTKVIFKEYSSPVNNVGIVDVKVTGLNARIKIKNFYSGAVSFQLKSNTSTSEVKLDPQGIADITTRLLPGENVISLVVNDDFPTDNTAYIVVPTIKPITALYITNKEGVDYFKTALESLGTINLVEATPPVIPDGEFDLYIIHEIDQAKLLPHTLEDVLKKAKQGKHVIVHAQSNSASFDYKKLGLVTITQRAGLAQLADVIQNGITKSVSFGSIKNHFATSNADCQPWVKTIEGAVVICQKIDGGAILWFGIANENDFKTTPDYPLFWNNYVNEIFDIKQPEVNLKTGSLYSLGSQKILTPSGEVTTDRLVLSSAGFYTFGDTLIAANLFDIEESNVNTKYELIEDNNAFASSGATTERNTHIAKTLILLALLLVIGELIYIKWRGDL